MKKLITITALGLLCLCLSAPAGAHMLWLTPDSHSVQPGQEVTVTIGFGHHYPEGQIEDQKRLKRVYAKAPDGSEVACNFQSPSACTFVPEQKGVYWLYAAMNPGFVSNTTSGKKLGNKKTLSNVVSCFAFRISAMTPVWCGTDADWNPPGAGALDLEMVPVNDPANIGKGNNLVLKVLFGGEPLAGASVASARAGDNPGNGPGTVETNTEGIARIELPSAGSWLFTANHQRPYPDKEKCDSFSYNTALTLDF